MNGALARIWTQNLLVRSQALYPVELQAQVLKKIIACYQLKNYINYHLMSKNILNNQLFIKNFFNYLLAMFPLSFILGNTIINLNIIFLIISSFYFFKSSIFKLNFILLDKLIFVFFCLIIFNGIINDVYFLNHHKEFAHWKGTFKTFLKSLGSVSYTHLTLPTKA